MTDSEILEIVSETIAASMKTEENWADNLQYALDAAGVDLANDQPDGRDAWEIVKLDDGRMVRLFDESATGAARYSIGDPSNYSDEEWEAVNVTPLCKYTEEEKRIEAMLSAVANEEGTIQAGDMLQFTSEPTHHTTTSVSQAFTWLTGKAYDTDYFCD